MPECGRHTASREPSQVTWTPGWGKQQVSTGFKSVGCGHLAQAIPALSRPEPSSGPPGSLPKSLWGGQGEAVLGQEARGGSLRPAEKVERVGTELGAGAPSRGPGHGCSGQPTALAVQMDEGQRHQHSD